MLALKRATKALVLARDTDAAGLESCPWDLRLQYLLLKAAAEEWLLLGSVSLSWKWLPVEVAVV